MKKLKDFDALYTKVQNEKIKLGNAKFEKEYGKFNSKERVYDHYDENESHDCATSNYSNWSFCKKHFIKENDDGFEIVESDEILNCKECDCNNCSECEKNYYEKNKDQFFKESFGIGGPDDGKKEVIKELLDEDKITYKNYTLYNLRKELLNFFKENKISECEGDDNDDCQNKFYGDIARTGSEYIKFGELKIFLGDHFIEEAVFGDGFFKINPGDLYFNQEKKEFHNENTNENFGGGIFAFVSHWFIGKKELKEIIKTLEMEIK